MDYRTKEQLNDVRFTDSRTTRGSHSPVITEVTHGCSTVICRIISLPTIPNPTQAQVEHVITTQLGTWMGNRICFSYRSDIPYDGIWYMIFDVNKKWV